MLQHTEADQGYPARIYRRSERAKVIYTTMLSLRSSRNKITKMVTGWAVCDTNFDTRFIKGDMLYDLSRLKFSEEGCDDK